MDSRVAGGLDFECRTFCARHPAFSRQRHGRDEIEIPGPGTSEPLAEDGLGDGQPCVDPISYGTISGTIGGASGKLGVPTASRKAEVVEVATAEALLVVRIELA